MKELMNDVLFVFPFLYFFCRKLIVELLCFSTRDGSLHIHLVEKTSDKSVDINIEASS